MFLVFYISPGEGNNCPHCGQTPSRVLVCPVHVADDTALLHDTPDNGTDKGGLRANEFQLGHGSNSLATASLILVARGHSSLTRCLFFRRLFFPVHSRPSPLTNVYPHLPQVQREL
jgi:hypothetical protein